MMDTDEARAENLVEELHKIPVGKLRGVLILLEHLVKNIQDYGRSRVTKKVSLFKTL